jgi:hypothetical protein
MRIIGPHASAVFCASLIAGVALSSAARPAGAAEKADKPGEGSARYLNISPVAAPIVVDGMLVNYIFLTIRIELRGGVDVTRLREKEPYFRDALVRAAHRHPFVKPGDYIHVDEAAVKRSVKEDAERIAGPGTVASVTIVGAQPQKVRGIFAPTPSVDTQRPPLP